MAIQLIVNVIVNQVEVDNQADPQKQKIFKPIT